MAARLASSAARRCVRSVNFFSRRGIGSRAQFLRSEAVDHNRIINLKDSIMDNKLIFGPPRFHPPCQSPPLCNCRSCVVRSYFRSYLPPPFVEEIKSTITSCLKPNPKPKPKPDILLRCRDVHDRYLFTGATSNGLLHFHIKNSGSHVLWNPLTESQDCKLMHLVDAISSYHLELYSLKTNSWRKIPCTHDFNYIETDNGYACISGGFYCVAHLECSGPCILSFDISTETFSILPTPIIYSYGMRYDFLEYKGSLCVLASDGDAFREPELWVLSDDGSWMIETFFRTCTLGWPLWFSHDGNLLYFASLVDDELVVFDRATGELMHLEVRCSSMIPFYRSFTQLNQL
ncbi:hypothetical protein SASPL_154751 [Salvia splendens]|uniref:F-box associated beta-propeller type 3 domain-containing protein n=1 Tax=Salvia splendens TaxID=180675 RepID=A0A8X8W0N5_SALSN|nr:hypothetical protein SASPL_154751 [Salvia splendens]